VTAFDQLFHEPDLIQYRKLGEKKSYRLIEQICDGGIEEIEIRDLQRLFLWFQDDLDLVPVFGFLAEVAAELKKCPAL
jgi:hypothetical protein